MYKCFSTIQSKEEAYLCDEDSEGSCSCVARDQRVRQEYGDDSKLQKTH